MSTRSLADHVQIRALLATSPLKIIYCTMFILADTTRGGGTKAQSVCWGRLWTISTLSSGTQSEDMRRAVPSKHMLECVYTVAICPYCVGIYAATEHTIFQSVATRSKYFSGKNSAPGRPRTSSPHSSNFPLYEPVLHSIPQEAPARKLHSPPSIAASPSVSPYPSIRHHQQPGRQK